MTALPVDPSVDNDRDPWQDILDGIAAVDTSLLSASDTQYLVSKAVDPALAVFEDTVSVNRPEDLPKNLRWAFRADRKCAHKNDSERCIAPPGFDPGILYNWRDKNGHTSPQFNPRWGNCEAHNLAWLPVNSDGEPTKYIFESGKGVPVWVAKSMVERIKTARFILFVEGTKQYLAVVSALLHEKEWLVVGVAGCQNWRSGGMPNADVDSLAADREFAAVGFDSDVLTNEAVFDAAKALNKVLVGATEEVGRYLQVPVNLEGNGVDDWLGASVAPERRTKALMNLLASKDSCKALPAKFPGKRKSTLSDDDLAALASEPKVRHATIDLGAGYVKVPDTVTMTNGVYHRKEGPVVAGFVPRIVRSYVVGDLHNLTDWDVFHDIEVTQNGVTYSAENVPDAQIAKRDGFDKMLRSIGITAPAWVSDPYSHSQVLAAMRHDAQTNAEAGEAMSHTGWWDHPTLGPVFLVPSGAVSAQGWITDKKTMFERGSNRSKIDLSALATASETDIKKAVELANEIFDCFHVDHQVFPLLMHSQVAIAGSGLMSRGTPCIKGLPESGKSVTVECYMTFNGRGMDPEVMIDQTGRKAVAVGYGLSNIFVALDDIKTADADPEAYKATVKGVYGNVRRGYDGGKAGASSMQMSETSRTGWAPGQPEQTNPTFTLTGEIVPPELDTSTLQRMFIHEHHTDHLINGARLAEITATGDLALANAAYLQHIAKSIVSAGGMAAWMKALREQATELRDQYAVDFPTAKGPSKRTAEVLAHRLIGISLWASFCVSVGVWTEAKAEDWEEVSVATLVDAMHWHFENYGSGSSTKSSRFIIEAIKNLVSGSPQWYIATSLRDGLTAVEGKKDGIHSDRPAIIERRSMLGCEHSVTHDKVTSEYVALNAAKVATALGMKPMQVEAALKAVAEPREVKGSKRYTRPIKAGGTSVCFYWIPREVWDAETDDLDLPNNVLPIRAAG